MASIGGPSTNVTMISYEQLTALDLERTARFDNETDRTNFQNAVDWLKEQHAAGVANPQAPIPMPTNAEDIGLAEASLSDLFSFMDDAILEAMKTLHEMAQTQRKAEQDSRQATAESEVASQNAAADKIRDSAIFGLVSGIVGSAMTIGSGLMSLKGAKESLKMSMEPLNVSGTKDNLAGLKEKLGALKERLNTMDPAEFAKFEQSMRTANTNADAYRQKWQAYATMTQGGQQLLTSGLEFGGKMMDAEKSRQDAKTTMIHYIRENLDDFVKQSTDLINDLRSKFNEFVQSRAQTERETSRFV
ncbi:MAG TPA: type III secretion system translocon subunit SctB [Geminicoccaceae bacterium]|nr:type III secretion system translocon subunit SctB [Geminicoccus sp.]HMU51950.1 type III secretion system translocon subunit SctB [Geminicoccaceae bacterium]